MKKKSTKPKKPRKLAQKPTEPDPTQAALAAIEKIIGGPLVNQKPSPPSTPTPNG